MKSPGWEIFLNKKNFESIKRNSIVNHLKANKQVTILSLALSRHCSKIEEVVCKKKKANSSSVPMSKISLFMLGSIIIAIIPGICLVDYLIPLKKTNRFYAASKYEKIFENFTYFFM